jgi:hypothetical protein
MNTSGTRSVDHARVRHEPRCKPPRQRGAALAICLLLLPIATLLGVTAMGTATRELKMAANAQYQARAFEAAEFAVEQAILSSDIDPRYTLSSPKHVPASGSAVLPGSTPDTYSYVLYYDPAPSGSGVSPEDAAAGLDAYHFVIEAAGYSARGAKDVHVQGFYVLRPIGWSGASMVCDGEAEDCIELPGSEPRRTFWRQQDAD